MGRKFYISDLHFGHTNCLKFDNRPWFTIEEHDKALIENWNKVVSPGDIVYILGDMFWCRTQEAIRILDQLNGQKILIKGNHDRCHDTQFIKRFVKITDYLEVDDEGRNIVLCHYPIPCFKNHYYGWYHLYGHVHNSFEANMMEHCKTEMTDLYVKPCEMYNCGAMMPWLKYTPRTLDEIIEGYKQYKMIGDKE